MLCDLFSHQYGKHDFRLAVSNEVHGLHLTLLIKGKQWNLQKLFNLLGNVQFRCDLLLISHYYTTASWRMYTSHLVHALRQFDRHVLSYYLLRSIHLHGTVHFATAFYRTIFGFIVSSDIVSLQHRYTLSGVLPRSVKFLKSLFKQTKQAIVSFAQKQKLHWNIAFGGRVALVLQ